MAEAYSGIFAALTTPFRDQDLFPEKLKDNIERYNGFDLAGYVIGGSTGEAVFLSDEECLALLRTARKAAAPGRRLIVGTGRESARHTLLFTNVAADQGADAALIVLPHYYRGLMSVDALKAFYETVADRARIPLLIYSIPRSTGITPPPELIIELSRHPNILGVKDSSGDLSLLQNALPRTASGTVFLLGAGGILWPGLKQGASGGILTLGAVAPELCVRLYHLFQRRCEDEGESLQQAVAPLNQAITKDHGVPGAKYALDLRGFYGGPCRLPLLPLSDEARRRIRDDLERLRLIGASGS